MKMNKTMKNAVDAWERKINKALQTGKGKYSWDTVFELKSTE